MAVVKDLGVATAYAYAVQGGYTGTEEEFAELLARQATVAAEAAASADAAAASATAAAGSESNASASAVAAAQSESNAASSESNAAGSASSASTSAATATTQAGNASSSATAASGSATAAANSASAAATSKTDAQAAATSAASSAAAAQTAQTAAGTAQDAAEDARDRAEAAAATLEDWLGYSLTDVPGVQIDFENNKWTRLGAAVGLSAGSDFDQFNAFGGRRRCNVADDGTVNAYYGDEGYAEDGSNGQVMVEQPKFYYRVVPLKLHKQAVGTGYDMLKANYYIGDTPRKGFKLHPAFINESGKEVPCVYIGAAKACIYDTSASEYNLTDAQTMAVAEDKLSSIFGAKPASGLSQQFTRPNVETLAQNRGTGWHSETSKVKMATILLMFVEGAGNLQAVFGQGVSTITDNSSYNCASITGSTSALGNASGSATSTVNEINGTETTHTTSGRVSISYRGEEDPYGNIYEFLYDVNVWGDGTMQGGQAYVCTDFNFAESKRTDNYEGCGWCFPASSGYIKYFGYGNGDYDWLLAPSSNGGSSSLPIGDYNYVTADLYGFRVASFGGRWNSGAFCGLFWFVQYGVGHRLRYLGARLEYYPQIAA